MKVLQIGAFFHPSVGGVERQMEEIAAHLIEQGIEVEVLTTDATHGTERRMQRLEENFRGVEVKRFRYLLAFGDFFRMAPGLCWYVFNAEFDIAHVHNVHDGHLLPVLIICKLRGKKLVLTGHNPFVVNTQKRGAGLTRQVKFYDRVVRLFSGGIDRYIALLPSEQVSAEQILKVPADRIRIVPNGIQEIYYTQQGDPQKFYSEWHIEPNKWQLIVGAAARLNFVKGFQNLKVAAERLPRVLFIFAGGDDGYYESLKRIFRDNSNVIFTKQYLPPIEMCNLYAALDVFLLPSVYEPFGMTLIEAMAQGKPVIATTSGGPAEIVKESFGRLVDPDDQAGWLKMIQEFNQRKETIGEMGEVAKKEAIKYKWNKVIVQIIAVYTELVH